MGNIREVLNVSLSIVFIGILFVCIVAVTGYSFGFIDLTRDPIAQGESNTTGVPIMNTSEHPQIDGEKLESEIFEQVNERRVDADEEPFVHSKRVRLIARLHNKDMAERHFFNHTNPDGEGSSERHSKYNGCNVTNENVAKWRKLPSNEVEVIASTIVDGWANSSAHNTTQMSEYYHVSGVGVYVTENRTLYVTQNFCREHPNA